LDLDQFALGCSRSVPTDWSRSVPADLSRSVPADWSRSVPADWSRSVPADWSRSVPADWSRSVPADWSRSDPQRPIEYVIDDISKDSGSYMLKRFNYVDLQGRLKRGPEWLFDIDSLTKSMNYEPVTAGNQTNDVACIEINVNARQAKQEKASDHEYILLPFMPSHSPLSSSIQNSDDKDAHEALGKQDEGVSKGSGIDNQERFDCSTQDVNTAEPSINTANIYLNTGSLNINIVGSNDLSMPYLKETGIFDDVYNDREVGAEANINNLELSTVVSHILTTRVHKDHPKEQIIRNLNLATQTRRMINFFEETAMAIGTKWVFRNKKDERGIIVRNKARMVAQGYTQEEDIDYNEVFAPVARIEAIRLLLAYASFIGFIVYQMDVKSAFLYGIIEEEVYVCQPPSFEDPHFPDNVYKVEKALYGLHQAPKAWYETLSTYLLENGFRKGTINKTLFIKKDRDDIILVHVYANDIIFRSIKKSLCDEFEQMNHKRFQMSSIGKLTFFLGLQVNQKDDGIFISQDKYVTDILKKFDFTTVKTTSILMEPNKALIKDAEAEDVDVHLYRLMIRSLMYLIDSRPNIMFAVCACARFQVTPKTSHIHAVKRIFRYLKGQPKLDLWYPRDSPFDLETFFDSDYARASLDRKSIIRGCQFLGKRLISWQCKKQTIVANSKTEAEYVAAAGCCRQVLWIQNQMLDYGFNLINTKIYIDNESTICIVKNLVFHSKTKHIEIKHHFIRNSYEKKLIQAYSYYCQMKANDAKHKLITAGEVAFLKKPTESEGFEQIVDFLNANPIKYALTVNPTIYTSCIQQFWDSSKVKIVTKDVQIRALVDGKNMINTEASIRRDPRLDDVEGTACLPNAAIFEELARMRVLSLEQIKTNQAAKIEKLKKRVKNLKGKKKKRTHGLKRLYKGRRVAIDADEDLSLIDETTQDQGRMNDEDLFGVNDLDGDEVIMDATASENVEQDATVAEKEVSAAADDVVTTAKSVEDQIAFDEEVVRKLYAQMKAEMEEEERIAREKNEANIDVIKELDDVQATIDANRQLAEQLQAQEREHLSIEKDLNSWLSSLNLKEKVIKGSKKTQAEVTKCSSKRAGNEIEQESAKRQRLEKEDDTTEIKRYLEIVTEDDDDVTIEATPLSSKSLTIVNYKIYKEGKKSYFKIIKADGNS
nr:putative ribonuclease H-like domain-containing protein [Tanacetum cinerariifolium]